MITMIYRMCLDCICAILLYMAHIAYTFFEIVMIFVKFVQLSLKRDEDKERQRISIAVDTMDKVPKHVVLLLGMEKPSYADLGRLVVWCATSGIPFVSFYDHTGALKNNERFLQNELSSRDCQISREAAGGMRCVRVGTRTAVRVTLLSSTEGRGAVASLAREWSHAKMSAKSVHADLVDEGLRSRLCGLPDPELALCCGYCCRTYGLLPWHIRLTEFVYIGSHQNISVNTFIGALKFYGRCEQRFGE